MARLLREHGGRHYAIVVMYALPDDAWLLELSEAVPAPETWADIAGAPAFIPGEPFLIARVPDEDPDREPTVLLGGRDIHVIPYDVMRWFMDEVAEEIERARATMARGERPVEG